MRNRLSSLLCGVMVGLFLVYGCISFGKPQKTIVLNMVAQSSGVLLAQELPGVAGEVLKYSNALLDTVRDTEILPDPDFNKWVQWMIKKLDIHPLLKVNFAELMKLVKIEVMLAEDPGKIIKLSRGVIENFIVGIKAGLR